MASGGTKTYSGETPGLAFREPPEGDPPEVVEDPDVLAGYLGDASNMPGGNAKGLVRARSEADVARLLKHLEGTSTSVLVVGSQSSLTGASVPLGDLVVSTRDLDRLDPVVEGVEEVEEVEGGEGGEGPEGPEATVRCGAGVLLSRLKDHVGAAGWFYPPAPTYDLACLGGTLATNAAGAATFKYGTTRDWVREISVVLADGWILDLERGAVVAAPGSVVELERPDGRVLRVPFPDYESPRVKKSSMGYHCGDPLDLVDLFVGSEGTLGVIVAARVGLVRAPAQVLGVMLFLDDEGSAVELVGELRRRSQRTWEARQVREVRQVREAGEAGESGKAGQGLDVRAIEHLDGGSLDLLRRTGAIERLRAPIPASARMCLFLELELTQPLDDLKIQDQIEALLEDREIEPCGGLGSFLEWVREHDLFESMEIAFPSDSRMLERFREIREAVPAAVNEQIAHLQATVDPRIAKVGGDMCLPFDRFAEGLDRYRNAFSRRGLESVIFGHISDGNVHPNVLPRSHGEYEAGIEALFEVALWVQEIGGSLMAEHGVGRNPLKQRLLRQARGAEGMEQMRRIRRAFDPDRRFARGVLLDDVR